MKTYKEICKLILDEFVNRKYKNNYLGLCYVSWRLWRNKILTFKEAKYFDKIMYWKRCFYIMYYINGYCWKPGAQIPRIKWLEKQIRK